MRLGLAFAALSLMTAPVMAQDSGVTLSASEPEAIPGDLAARGAGILAKHGAWTFRAPRIVGPHDPVCVETWTFRADGGMTVVSGSQTVEKSWRMANEDGFTKLYTTGLSSTEGRDCMGELANPADYPQTESGGFAVLFFADDLPAYLCNPVVVKSADGTTTPMYRNEDCWGELRSVPKPVTVEAPTNEQTAVFIDWPRSPDR